MKVPITGPNVTSRSFKGLVLCSRNQNENTFPIFHRFSDLCVMGSILYYLLDRGPLKKSRTRGHVDLPVVGG